MKSKLLYPLKQVAALSAGGLSIKEIAHKMGLKPQTIRVYLYYGRHPERLHRMEG